MAPDLGALCRGRGFHNGEHVDGVGVVCDDCGEPATEAA